MKSIKRISLAALLALALTATVGATSASAAAWEPEQFPASVEGDLTALDFEMGVKGLIVCGGGNSFDVGYLANPAVSKLTSKTTSDPSSCKYWDWGGNYKGVASPVKMNGCQFGFSPGTETSKGVFSGSFGLTPAGCGPVKMETPPCEFNIETSSWSGSAKYTNTEAGKVKIETSVPFKFTYKGTFCGGSGSASGTVHADWLVEALNGEGASTNIDVINADLGPRVEGGFKTAPTVRFVSSRYPAPLTSTSGTFAFSRASGPSGWSPISCTGTTMAGTLTESTALLGLYPKYGSCSVTLSGTSYPVQVAMNGCHYALKALAAEEPYAGALGITCDEGPGPVELKVYSNSEMKTTICTLKLSAQKERETVSLQNHWAEGTTTLEVGANATGFEYERANLLCGGTKTASDGVITYNTTLVGP